MNFAVFADDKNHDQPVAWKVWNIPTPSRFHLPYQNIFHSKIAINWGIHGYPPFLDTPIHEKTWLGQDALPSDAASGDQGEAESGARPRKTKNAAAVQKLACLTVCARVKTWFSLRWHQAWLAGKSPINGGCHGKAIEQMGGCSQLAMFDETSGYISHTRRWSSLHRYTNYGHRWWYGEYIIIYHRLMVIVITISY